MRMTVSTSRSFCATCRRLEALNGVMRLALVFVVTACGSRPDTDPSRDATSDGVADAEASPDAAPSDAPALTIDGSATQDAAPLDAAPLDAPPFPSKLDVRINCRNDCVLI